MAAATKTEIVAFLKLYALFVSVPNILSSGLSNEVWFESVAQLVLEIFHVKFENPRQVCFYIGKEFLL